MLATLEHLHAEPILTFAILIAVILSVPALFERLQLPGLVGLLVAGVILGPHGLQLLSAEGPVMPLLSDIGLLYLMFVAGLEIDMVQFQKMKYRSAGFGSLTFFLPLIVGIGIGYFSGFSWVSSILIGSLIASHSLLTYPILSQFDVTRNGAVITTLGATIFTDIAALLVLAICISVGEGNFSAGQLVGLLIGLGLYAIAILVGFERLGRAFFKRSDNNQENQFLFVLLAIFIAAIGAELIGVEKIVGAFLAGLAINEVVGDSPVKDKVVFVGTVLFIPIFFVDIGLLIDIPAFFSSGRALGFAALMIAGLLISKGGAVAIAQRLYGFSNAEALTMWGMTLPQVATTLAAALVGNNAGLINDDILNSVVVMLLVTAILGPLLVRKTARNLPLPDEPLVRVAQADWILTAPASTFNVLVPVYNPKTEQYLIELAALIARARDGVIKPLAIANAQVQMDSAKMNRVFEQRQGLLNHAVALGKQLKVPVEPVLRIDQTVANGISRSAKEQHANLIVMGLGQRSGLKNKLFGNLIDNVLWAAHCPVAITRLHQSPRDVQSILVPIKHLSATEAHKIQLTLALAQACGARVTLLHVTPKRLSGQHETEIKSQMMALIDPANDAVEVAFTLVCGSDIRQTILKAASRQDLVVMRTHRRRTSAGGLAVGDLSSRLIQQLKCSVILLGEPDRRIP
jgi:Kef-type K+ transport system membrane component KefB/nucleotide-binding universal stress UspA family protein